jgi:hypothetical protein
LERPLDQHIDGRELNALVPWSSQIQPENHALSLDAVGEAKTHLRSCVECGEKVSKYRQLVNRLSNLLVSEAGAPAIDCPKDVHWYEVAAGLRPELEATQLIMHAALCDHCGPLLRAATSLNDDPTPYEEKLLAKLRTPSRPDPDPRSVRTSAHRQFMRWMVPAQALIVLVVVLSTMRWSSPTPLSGPTFAEFAVRTHQQHAQGRLALDIRSDSQQALNEWFNAKSDLHLALPASPAAPGEERPYRIEGARLVQVSGKNAAFIAYQAETSKLQTDAASLMVIPESVAVASGGVVADFQKVSFHYTVVDGYKVVTWSMHGLTYGLVSQEGNRTQRSCMVCHSAMRDRDLTRTPTPLFKESNALHSILQ